MIKRFTPFLFLFLSSLLLNAATVNVKILSNTKLSSIIISTLPGEYLVSGDGNIVNDSTISIFQLSADGDSIQLKTIERIIGKFSVIKFNSNSPATNITIKSQLPERKVRAFEGDLEISVSNSSLKVINVTDIEHYVAGVIEAEAGTRASSEYFKLQAILCRTYALTHLRRHEGEGFHLCDQVHCQVYRNSTKNFDILNAVEATKGLVIVDSDLNLITAAFHSNCGGQTINSEDVWSLPTSYLKSVKDTFCLYEPHAKWKKKIAMKEWQGYLEEKHKYSGNDSSLLCSTVSFPQDDRCIFYTDRELKIPLKTIRADWGLNSTYFSIDQEKDSLVFNGRGYGHGVGLCQEGAMRMARIGHPYQDILHFYYKDVHLVNLSVLDFFKQE